MDSPGTRIRDLADRVHRQLPLNIEVPSLHVGLLRVTVEEIEGLTQVRQQSRRAASSRAKARWEWVRQHSVRRQSVIERVRDWRRAGEAALRHRVVIPAIAPAITVEDAITTAKHGRVFQVGRDPDSRY